MSSATATLTADELFELPSTVGRCELIQGELREMCPAGADHGLTTIELATSLSVFVRQHQLGRVFAAETGFLIQRDPDTVLAPDVAFISQQRFDETQRPSGYWPGAPDLAVEIVSPSDRWSELQAKALLWIECGCELVWIVDPKTQQVTVFASSGEITVLKKSDQITAARLLPGFSVKVASLFA